MAMTDKKFRKLLKSYSGNINTLQVVPPPAKVRKMETKKEEITEIPEEIPEAEPDMGFVEEEIGRMPFQGGYSSRSKAQGDGLTTMLYGFRIESPGDERW